MSETRRQSTSSTTMPPAVLVNDSRTNSAENIQIALAPHIQSFLSQTGRRHSCCSVMLPVAFERAAAKSWLDPRFDSPVLEGQFLTSVFPHIRMRYRFTLSYILLCSLAWFVYFLAIGSEDYWVPISSCLATILVATAIALYFTQFDLYRAYTNLTSAITALALCATSLVFVSLTGSAFSPLGHFAICMEIVLILYTALPMRLWLSASIAITYSVLFETLTFLLGTPGVHGRTDDFYCKILVLRILLQIAVHIVGLHVMVMNIVRMRGTFMKVGQNLLVRRQLEMEKQLKEKMIHSVMPPTVADMLMNEGMDPDFLNTSRSEPFTRPKAFNDVKSLFRPFHMNSMDNVSILFADIVGFTNMSSTKTAEQLVEILNGLFERFDDLCSQNGCEKISTLGDCYYCVSGCPEPRPDHAICCVEMGLGMIEAMRTFDAQRNEGVKMRVGVHTGTVLCGIVGTRRVKFDVWSNDVTLANRMESTGKPEQVHISEETSSFLGDAYYLDEGEEVSGHRTYYVVGRRKDPNTDGSHLMPGCHNRKSISQSETNISVDAPQVPPASPVGQISTSLNPSPVMSIRPKLPTLSLKFRKISANAAPDLEKGNHKPPKIVITAKSLPGSLDSDHEEEGCCRGSSGSGDKDGGHTSEETANKLKNKLLSWKVPKFLKKIDDLKRPAAEATTTQPHTLPKQPVDEHAVHFCVEQNGYQQLPVVIETPRLSANTLDIPQRPLTIANSPTSATAPPCTGTGPDAARSPDPSCCSAAGRHSLFDDVIDIRSYISQSRSDISPFARSGSYRSQCGRSGISDTSPMCRPRASTLAAQTNIPQHVWPDGLSICASATSRKDSGIKSNSRRSSIQHQIYALNQTAQQHRVSGYFTSSQSSLSNIGGGGEYPSYPAPQPIPLNFSHALSDPLAACLLQLRKQSDLQLIRCVRDNAKSQRSYLVKPPLKPISLYFKSRQMEREFRSKAHRFGLENESEGPPTLATPRYNTYIDIFVGIVVYLCVSGALFLMAPSTTSTAFSVWVSLFAVFTAMQFFALFLFTRQMLRRHSLRAKSESAESCADRIFESISSWYPWHICLAILMACPVILVMVNFLLLDLNQVEAFEYHYGFLIFVCIVQFCNFTQLNCWMRNILALLAGLCFIGIALGQLSLNARRVEKPEADKHMIEEYKWFYEYHTEVYLDLISILILVWFLNREFEIGYRLTFYGNAVANKDKVRVQNMKNQADMLLHNIIPKHVAEHLKNTAKYSENHHDVGIIFASIVNFNEMYDESYLGGKEYLRVLNELIGDFDELLSRSEFKCIEKIKTIGSTFMAASGLDPFYRGENNEHLAALIEFSLAMQSVVSEFNKDLIEFNLVLRIGFNIGEVTAGVIGTSKLYYDIWGDAVNVASRMDSTGVAARVQVGKDCLPYLESWYNFKPRGKVYVKGKDHMEVFLLTDRKADGKRDGGEVVESAG